MTTNNIEPPLVVADLIRLDSPDRRERAWRSFENVVRKEAGRRRLPGSISIDQLFSIISDNLRNRVTNTGDYLELEIESEEFARVVRSFLRYAIWQAYRENRSRGEQLGEREVPDEEIGAEAQLEILEDARHRVNEEARPLCNTDREREMLEAISRAGDPQSAADQLGVQVNTIHQFLSRIRRRVRELATETLEQLCEAGMDHVEREVRPLCETQREWEILRTSILFFDGNVELVAAYLIAEVNYCYGVIYRIRLRMRNQRGG